MSRRRKWFARLSLKRAAGRSAARRNGRALSFEQYEPRIALSTNAALNDWAVTTGAGAEGGFIATDFATFLNSHLVAASGASTMDGDVALAFSSELRVHENLRFDSFDEVMSRWRHIRQIEPHVGLQHPEGGQIALIDPPAAGMSGLTVPTMDADAQVARRPLQPPTVDGNLGPRQTHEIDGLRSRAVVFEVADFGPRARSTADELELANPSLAARELTTAKLSTGVADNETPTTSGRAPHLTSQSMPQRPSAAQAHRSQSAGAVHPSTVQAARWHIFSRLLDSSGGKMTLLASAGERSANPRGDDLAARDAALAELGQADPAPLGDAATPEGRSRKLLALALVLTLGSAPLGKFLRRRAPDKSTEQRPPRRRLRFLRL
jgi:hypothetical protein